MESESEFIIVLALEQPADRDASITRQLQPGRQVRVFIAPVQESLVESAYGLKYVAADEHVEPMTLAFTVHPPTRPLSDRVRRLEARVATRLSPALVITVIDLRAAFKDRHNFSEVTLVSERHAGIEKK
jgi:hypothetical protein